MTILEDLLGAAGTDVQQPLPAGAPLRAVLSRSLVRTAVLARGGRAVELSGDRIATPLVAPQLGGGARERARRLLGAGWVVSSGQGRDGSPLAELLAAAGARSAGLVSVGAEGAMRLTATVDGVEAVVRIGEAATAADPRRAMGALQALAGVELRRAPVLLRSGRTARFGWTCETRLPGRRPRKLIPQLLGDVAAFCAALPRASSEPAPQARSAVLDRAAPTRGAELDEVAGYLREHPLAAHATMKHGDLWLGNCLVDGQCRVLGVVDWDAWQPAGLPGGDLLHLVATEARLRRRVPLGRIWLDRPWDWPEFVGAARAHWPEWADDPSLRWAVGVDWWHSQVAADLTRAPARAADARWVAANVTAVLDAVTRTPH